MTAHSRPEAACVKVLPQNTGGLDKTRDTELNKRVLPEEEAAIELMLQGRGKLRTRHHGSAASAERKETRGEAGAELRERSQGESDRRRQPQCQPATGPPMDRRKDRSGLTKESSAPQMPIGMEAHVLGGGSRHGEDQTQRVDPVRQRELRAHSGEDQTQRVDPVRHLELRAQRPIGPERKG